jgi:nucleotide-binding universal stress UspA family protein
LPFLSKGSSQVSQEHIAAAVKALKEKSAALEKAMKGCTINFEVLQGDAKNKIVEAAKLWGANVIFIGQRGIHGVERMLLGSVSQGVLLQSPCPVVIVKSDPDKAASCHAFKKILIAVDNSAYSKEATKWIKKLNWAADAEFKLVTVVAPLIDQVESLQDASRVEALGLEHEALIGAAKKELESEAADLRTQLTNSKISCGVGQGDPREVILQAAFAMQADLIVMGSHGRTGLEKLLIGSVSQAIASQAECSVAVVRGLVPKGTGKMQLSGRFEI